MVDGGPIERGEMPLLNLNAKQITLLIKSMRRGKFPGHDGLSMEHLKYAGFHLPRLLSMFFNMYISHSYLPGDLMKK